MANLPDKSPSEELTDQYDDEAAAYLAHWVPVLRQPALALVASIETSGVRRVLDIGTGCGSLLPVLAERFPGARIAGVDRSVGMLSHAPRDVPLATMDAAALALSDASFDAAVMCFVLFHLPDPVAGLREARRVLKRNGAIYLSTWGGDITSPAVNIWNRALDASGAHEVARLANHDLMDTPEKVTGLLESAGFVSARATVHDFSFPIDPDGLLQLRTGVGGSRQRVKTLTDEARRGLIEGVRAELSQLSADDLTLRMKVILSTARA